MHIIREELHQIVEDTVLDLSGKYRIFHNAVIQQGGSMVEGTKIGQPDEFDYVILLPALQEQLVTPRGELCKRLRHQCPVDQASFKDKGTIVLG